MKIAIVGAGALGLIFAAALSTNNEVVLIDINQEMVDEINKNGCEYLDQDLIIKSHPVCYLNGSYNEPCDLVMVLVKTNYTLNSLDANRGLFGANTYVLTLQNGLGNKEKLLNYVDEDHLIIGVTRNNAVRLSLNKTRRANRNITTFGFNRNNEAFVKQLADEFNKVGFETVLHSNIDELVWSKVFLNIATNPFCAVYNLSLGQLMLNDELWSRCQKVILEGVNVANSLGLKFNASEEINKIYQAMLGVDGYPSMWQDITNKRVSEIYSLNGEIVRLGKLNNIDVSENIKIVEEILKIEATF